MGKRRTKRKNPAGAGQRGFPFTEWKDADARHNPITSLGTVPEGTGRIHDRAPKGEPGRHSCTPKG